MRNIGNYGWEWHWPIYSTTAQFLTITGLSSYDRLFRRLTVWQHSENQYWEVVNIDHMALPINEFFSGKASLTHQLSGSGPCLLGSLCGLLATSSILSTSYAHFHCGAGQCPWTHVNWSLIDYPARIPIKRTLPFLLWEKARKAIFLFHCSKHELHPLNRMTQNILPEEVIRLLTTWIPGGIHK